MKVFSRTKEGILIFILGIFLFFLAEFAFALEITYPPILGAEPPQVFLEKIEKGEYRKDQMLFLWTKYIYHLSITISGLLVFFLIVSGGILYLISGGSVEKIKTAKARISSGILGSALLLFSYIIIYTLNPQLVMRPHGFLPPGYGGPLYGVYLYSEQNYQENRKEVVVSLPDLEGYLGFIPKSLKFFSVEDGKITEWKDEETRLENLRVVIYSEKDWVKGEYKMYTKNAPSFPFEPKSIFVGFITPPLPKEEPEMYIEIPLGFLIERVQKRGEEASAIADKIHSIGSEKGTIITHASLREVAECLNRLTQECKCDRLTEKCPERPGDSECPKGECRDPCDRCISNDFCKDIEDPSLANLCSALPKPEEELLSCKAGECNLRLVIDKKREELESLTNSLRTAIKNAEKVKINLEKRASLLEIGEAVMRDSMEPPLSYYDYIPIRNKDKERWELWNDEEGGYVWPGPTPDPACNTEAWKGEITPSCILCPCNPGECDDYILFCYGNAFIPRDNPKCQCSEQLHRHIEGEPSYIIWYSPDTFPEGRVLYNGVWFDVPSGGVSLSDSTAHGWADYRCQVKEIKPEKDDTANFYIKKEGNEDLLSLALNALASIQEATIGPFPEPVPLEIGCPDNVFQKYITKWGTVKNNAHQNEVAIASSATGVRRSLILAQLSWESGFRQFAGTGKYPCDMYDGGICNTPGCRLRGASIRDAFERLWKSLAGSLEGALHGYTIHRIPVSAATKNACGGDMGLAQASPPTWEAIMGLNKDPWDIETAYRFAALKLQRGGAVSKNCIDEKNAAWGYVGKVNWREQHAYCIVKLANKIAEEIGEEKCLFEE